MKRGKFIVFEGGDGAGKDTQIALMKKHFGTETFVYTRDPGGTEIGMKLRAMLQYGKDLCEEAELFLLLAARAEVAYKVIEPALAAGKNVVANRFDLSTYAYQIYGRRRERKAKLIKTMSELARRKAVPDLVILLDVPPEVGLARSRKRAQKVTRFEEEALAFHRRVQKGYRAGAKHFRHVITVDSNRPPEAVWADVEKALKTVVR
ncbi:MAG: dTMP kinase [Patescibacteria group bacterium]|nr:dTMP kinase [Patescibacteria group bacterium]MDE1966397.1 dTMP kinase [Patescibacteria group bacterium]